MKQISITIGVAGDPKIEASGYTGAGCKSATAGIERALGVGAEESRTVEAPEMYMDSVKGMETEQH